MRLTRLLSLTLLIFTLSSGLVAQTQTGGAAAVDAKTHADSVRLVEVSGARKRMEDALPGILLDAKAKLTQECPNCSDEFIKEWQKRFKQQLSLDGFIAIQVESYEKYLTDPEILELIALREAQAAGKPVAPSPELKAKLTAVTPDLTGEIVSRSSGLGAKIGTKVSLEIQAEHPDWIAKAPAKP